MLLSVSSRSLSLCLKKKKLPSVLCRESAYRRSSDSDFLKLTKDFITADPATMRIPLGPKQAEQATKWVSSAMGYGAAAALFGCYLTDWKVIVTYIPFYGSKFDEK